MISSVGGWHWATSSCSPSADCAAASSNILSVSNDSSRTYDGTTKPDGTGRPSALMRARLAPLPPLRPTSWQASSANQITALFCSWPMLVFSVLRSVIANRPSIYLSPILCFSVIDDRHRTDRSSRGPDPLDGQHGELEGVSGELVEVRQVLQVPVVLLPHDAVGLPELLALEHRPHRRVEGHCVYAHHAHALGDEMERGLPGHAAVVAEVTFLIVVVGGSPRLDQDDVLLLELVADRLERIIYLAGRDARPVLLVAEVQHDPVGEAVVQGDLARARAIGPDVLEGVHVGAGMVALDHGVGSRQLVHAVFVRPDALREVFPGIEHQHLGRVDAREGHHVPVHGYREVYDGAHAFSPLFIIACSSSKCCRRASPAFSGAPSLSASSRGRCSSASSCRSMSVLRAVTTTRASTLKVLHVSRRTLLPAASTIRRWNVASCAARSWRSSRSAASRMASNSLSSSSTFPSSLLAAS